MSERVTSQTLRQRKAAGIPLAGLTAYDYPTAVLIDRAGLDLILVGDSLGPLMLGHKRIEETTLTEMIHHCRAVSRGATHAMVIGDMPFGTYEITPEATVENAVRFLKEGGVDAVKLEGGIEIVPAVRALVAARIPVIGHLAMAHVQRSGNTFEEQSMALVNAAIVLEDAGVDAIVLVGLPAELAATITQELQWIPTIGYLSGPDCNGQLLVTPHMLGLLPPENPVPGTYASLGTYLTEIFHQFRNDIQTRQVVKTGGTDGMVAESSR